MIVHFIFFIVLLLMIPSINRYSPFYILSFGVLFLFLSLRYEYGPDYVAYFEIHQNINRGIQAWGESDWLYKQLNLIFPNFYVLIAVLSLFYLITIYKLIKSNLKVEMYWFATMILLINPYLFLTHLSSIRQTIAICIFILSIKYIIDRKALKYFITIIIAANFHFSAIILLPLYFIINQKQISKKIFFIIVMLLFVFIVTPLFEIVMEFFLQYLPYHYTIYYREGLGNSLRATIISSFYLALILFNFRKLEGKEVVYGKLSLIAAIIMILAYKVSMITRVGMYFDIFMIVTLPIIFSKFNNKIIKISLFIILVSIYLLRYYSFFTNPINSIYYKVYTNLLGL